MTPEIWRALPGDEGGYEVSDLGRVRSVARHTTHRNGHPYTIRGRVLSTQPHCKGYVQISIRHRPVFVHRLVLEAFVGPRPEGAVCRHLDGDRTNNRLENLAWGTPAENEADKVRHGTDNRGEGNGRARLTEEQVLAIRASKRSDVSWARELGFPRSTIRGARLGETWRHL